jgi:hypothetical protein
MTPNERFRRFKDRTGLGFLELADMFGVNISSVSGWYHNKNGMAVEFQRTLLRFEAENIDKLTKVRPRTISAFQAGRERAKVEMVR